MRGRNFLDLYIDSNVFRLCGSMLGGAIAFDDVSPTITAQNTYENNFALMSGDNLISYP